MQIWGVLRPALCLSSVETAMSVLSCFHGSLIMSPVRNRGRLFLMNQITGKEDNRALLLLLTEYKISTGLTCQDCVALNPWHSAVKPVLFFKPVPLFTGKISDTALNEVLQERMEHNCYCSRMLVESSWCYCTIGQMSQLKLESSRKNQQSTFLQTPPILGQWRER